MTRTYAGAALRLQRQESPRLLAVYFEGIDRLMHLFGALMPPALPGADSGRAARYGRVVERFYAAMDAQVGRFMEAAGNRGTLLVISDHGFKLGAERPRHPALRTDVFAAEWHRDPGILMAWGRGVRRGARIEEADIYDIAPTVLAYFGAPASETMRGRALTELFDAGFLPPSPRAFPPTSRASGRPPAPPRAERTASSSRTSGRSATSGAARAPQRGYRRTSRPTTSRRSSTRRRSSCTGRCSRRTPAT